MPFADRATAILHAVAGRSLVNSSRSHYVDAAGLIFVKERILRRAQEIANLGLSFRCLSRVDAGNKRTRAYVCEPTSAIVNGYGRILDGVLRRRWNFRSRRWPLPRLGETSIGIRGHVYLTCATLMLE